MKSKARVLALQVLYEADVAGHPVEASFAWLKEEAGLPEATSDYSRDVVGGVLLNRDTLDVAIRKYAPAWPVSQLAVIDRNILRLALFEIRFRHEIPRKVAINEAVELAKTFGSESSPRFVNGVLGSVMDEVEGASVDPGEIVVSTSDNFG